MDPLYTTGVRAGGSLARGVNNGKLRSVDMVSTANSEGSRLSGGMSADPWRRRSVGDHGVPITLAAAAFVLLGTVSPAHAHGVPDQQQLLAIPPCFGLQSVFGGAVHQSFTPSKNTAVGVDAMLDISGVVTVTVELWEGECPSLGAVLGTGSQSLPTGPGQIAHFDLDQIATLVPGQRYTLKVTATDANLVSVCGATSPPLGPYASGRVHGASCNEFVGSDGYFVTYAADVIFADGFESS